ncbi:MAG: queuosine precursor transporter [Dehalococcoidia bacterium]
MKRDRYYDVVMAAFVAVLLISNVTANKLVQIWGLTLTGATPFFPISYIFGDILTEVYGYARTRRVIWTGFGLQALAAGGILLAISLPPPKGLEEQANAFNRALSTTTWIVIGSLVAYWCGEFVNSYVLARLKLLTQGRRLWTRTIGSTVVGQAVDTVVFVAIAFWLGSKATGHPLPAAVLWKLVWSVYIFKVGVEVVLTPFTYLIVNALKRVEGQDYFDRGTNFNPFSRRERRGRHPA